ncbi:hypothetical protein LI328DRAFT_36455 [Trichoderma asperelloides]|nr:hypothetical protein LI328DRAFT_36455 [Trichoderma asperelloides]
MGKQTQPQQQWIRERSSSRNEARVPAVVGPAKIISCMQVNKVRQAKICLG